MKKYTTRDIIIGVLVIGVLILGGFLLAGKEEIQAPDENILNEQEQTAEETRPETTAPQSTTPQTSQPSVSAPQPKTADVTVRYTETGFEPSIVVITRNQTVRFVNENPKDRMWIASDSHPQHDAYIGFDQRTSVGPNGSYQFTFTKTGNWNYHNDMRTGHGGRIVVKYE